MNVLKYSTFDENIKPYIFTMHVYYFHRMTYNSINYNHEIRKYLKCVNEI